MQITNFNTEKNYDDSKPAIKLILETENIKEVRILMKQGQKMKEHKSSFPIVIHVIYGEIEFEVANEKHLFESGSILSLKANVPHSLFAREDSMLRLSLSKQDDVRRVESVVE